MGLISPGGENLLDFLEVRQVLSTYDGDIRGPLWWPQERPVPMRVARGPLGIPLPSMPVLRPCVESVSEPERFLAIADMDIWVLLESPQGTQSSSRVETGMSGNFLSCGKGVKDPLEVPEVRCD